MGFFRSLRTYTGRNVEVVLWDRELVAGVLIRVGFSYVTVQTLGVPGYDGSTEDVIIRSRAIDYVRII